MKSLLKSTIAAAAMLGSAAIFTGPAQARTDFSISIGVPNAVGFDYNSGGYCDSYGCPDRYWDYQVWYGPVFWHGRWYRGPVYFRQSWDGNRVYWIRGGWRHDQWRGQRPAWWYQNHYYAGPALGYEFYSGHGFRHDRDRYWHGRDWNDRGDHHDWNRDHDGNDRGDHHDWNGQGDHHDWNDHGDHHDDHGDHGNNPHDHWNNANAPAAPSTGHGNSNSQNQKGPNNAGGNPGNNNGTGDSHHHHDHNNDGNDYGH